MQKELEKQAELARKLQEEEQKEKEKRDLEKEMETAPECEICISKILSQDYFLMEKCGHMYHKNCVTAYLQNEVNSRKFPLICPHPKCKSELLPVEIGFLLDPESKRKWEDYTFKMVIESNPADYSFCPTPNCQYVFVWDASKDTNDFNCPQCKQRYCLNCRCQYHAGQTCKEYQISKKFTADDQMFVKFVKGMKFKKCPKCKFWVEKNEGCNHMTCRCKKEFCYVCGGDYPQCYCKTGKIPPPEIEPEVEKEEEKKQNEEIKRPFPEFKPVSPPIFSIPLYFFNIFGNKNRENVNIDSPIILQQPGIPIIPNSNPLKIISQNLLDSDIPNEKEDAAINPSHQSPPKIPIMNPSVKNVDKKPIVDALKILFEQNDLKLRENQAKIEEYEDYKLSSTNLNKNQSINLIPSPINQPKPLLYENQIFYQKHIEAPKPIFSFNDQISLEKPKPIINNSNQLFLQNPLDLPMPIQNNDIKSPKQINSENSYSNFGQFSDPQPEFSYKKPDLPKKSEIIAPQIVHNFPMTKPLFNQNTEKPKVELSAMPLTKNKTIVPQFTESNISKPKTTFLLPESNPLPKPIIPNIQNKPDSKFDKNSEIFQSISNSVIFPQNKPLIEKSRLPKKSHELSEFEKEKEAKKRSLMSQFNAKKKK